MRLQRRLYEQLMKGESLPEQLSNTVEQQKVALVKSAAEIPPRSSVVRSGVWSEVKAPLTTEVRRTRQYDVTA